MHPVVSRVLEDLFFHFLFYPAARAAEEDKGRKRKRKAKGAVAEDPEKPDGRAGPKSENVVLQKSMYSPLLIFL